MSGLSQSFRPTIVIHEQTLQHDDAYLYRYATSHPYDSIQQRMKKHIQTGTYINATPRKCFGTLEG